MIFWFFGLPGSGKDFLAELLARAEGIPHVDADAFLTEANRAALLAGTYTVADRHAKLRRVAAHVRGLLAEHPDIAVADSLPDEASRELVNSLFEGDVTFILVTESLETHRRRLANRKGHFFSAALVATYIAAWEPVRVPHILLDNERPLPEIIADLQRIFAGHSATAAGQGKRGPGGG